jgi:hypothetical protein
MKQRVLAIAAIFLAASPAFGQKWELSENKLGLGVFGAEWTISEDFPGTKVVFDGQYSIMRKPGQVSEERRCCIEPNQPEHSIGLVEAHLQWGLGETGLEYAEVELTPWATQWDSDAARKKGVHTARDIVEWGVFQFGHDDPLGVESYTSISLARGGRLWDYKWSATSPFSVLFGFQASLGWNWSESIDQNYRNVSTPFVGLFVNLAIAHEKWGALYTADRTINGFTLSNPTRGGASSREARIRFGYFNQVYRCLAVDFFFEKRSFYFLESGRPDLYTSSKRYGGELSCRFR